MTPTERLKLLTPTERRIAELLGQGLTYFEVGMRLNLHPENVRAYTSRGIFKKLGMRTLPRLVRWWIYHVELPAAGCHLTG